MCPSAQQKRKAAEAAEAAGAKEAAERAEVRIFSVFLLIPLQISIIIFRCRTYFGGGEGGK